MKPHVNPEPRPSASVIVLRDSPAGLQVLMLRRAEKPNDQNSGAAVFPGGLLDAQDSQPAAHACVQGLDDAAASARLGLPAQGLSWWLAALRECFEECGLLYADQPGAVVALPASERRALREALNRGTLGVADFCQRFGLRLDASAFTYYSHWVTPPGRPKRFDTRFFVAVAPPAQQAEADNTELLALMWLTPAEALAPERGLKLLNVTELTLRELARHPSTASVLAEAAARPLAPAIRPVVGRTPDGQPHVLMPDAWAYHEVQRQDPEGRGQVLTSLVPGRAVALGPRVARVTANNGSQMTGPGTNSYFVGSGSTWALIDPGPDDAAHVQALQAHAATLPAPLSMILCTHTHKDHSPAAAAMHAATGAPRAGRVAGHPEWQDLSFQPERVLAHGERIALGPDCTLRVLHTPGHASNHLCFLLEQEGLLFTGDHLMQGSTVVINPPDGDMAAYLDSLRALLAEPIEHLAPGHGFLMGQPQQVVHHTIAHRLAREAKVAAALAAAGPASAQALLPQVYGDVPERLHAMALRSLQAHLHKLQQEGHAIQDGGVWQAASQTAR